MADEADVTAKRMEFEESISTRNVAAAVAAIDPGEEGDCFYCGEWFARTVFVESVGEYCCGRCRDKRGLP